MNWDQVHEELAKLQKEYDELKSTAVGYFSAFLFEKNIL